MALAKNYKIEMRYHNDMLINNETLRENFPNVPITITEQTTIDLAYFMVSNIVGDKSNLSVFVTVYKDSTKQCMIDNLSYNFIPDTDDNSLNFIKQAYLYLKTLPIFVDALDC